MGQTLTHGVYLPDEGERNCYSGLAANWQILDTSVGTIAANTAALSGKAPLVHTHVKSDITDFPAYGTTAGTICEGNDSRLSDARTPVAHTHSKADITDLFNSANTWTDLNSYNQSIQITANFNIGAAPSSDVYGGFNFGNGNTNIGNVTARVSSAGITYSRLYVSNKYANGALDPNGTLTNVELQVGLKANGNRFIYSNASWDNSLIPYANNAYNLGSSSYQWNNVYCSVVYSPAITNSNNAASPSDSSVSSIVALRSIMTYTSGDPDAAARLNFRIMGTGEKSFYPHETNQYSFGLPPRAWSNSYIQHGYFTGIQQGDEYSSNTRTNLTLTANRDSTGVSGILVDSFRSNTTQGQAHHILGFGMKENSARYSGCRMYWSYDSNADKYNFALCPTKQGTNQPASFSLGLTGFYWDKINECNPGALSLPVAVLNNTYDISGDITDLTGGNNSITAARTGWIFVKSDNATEISIENTTTGMGASDHSAVAATLMVSIPVTSGETLNIIVNCTSIDKAYLLPCQGNV